MKKLKFGKAFSDQINKTNFKHGHFHKHKKSNDSWQESFITNSYEEEESPLLNPWYKMLFSVFILVFFAAFFARLFHLQIVEGKTNRERADFNRIKVKVIHAPRGVIYDRNGKILAQNEPSFRLIQEDEKGSTKVTKVSREEALQMEVSRDPRFADLEIDHLRAYPLGKKASHILGYVSEITDIELKDPNFKNYQLGDTVGRGGIEETYEKILKGTDGGEVIEVDAAGNKIRTLRRTEPIPGQNLVLAIDGDLQQVAYDQLEAGIQKAESCCGTVVAQDPKNGEVLALVSIPSFDPKNIAESLTAVHSPILNRAIAGVYPPGSTFKMASVLAGLSSGKITPTTVFEDTGIMNLGPYSFANWYFTQYGQKEGFVDAVKALKRSNDIYFYRLGELTGEKILGDTAKQLGLGRVLGIDIPGEVAGTIPDNDWKLQAIGDVWYPGDTLHMSIGQGFVLTTPLQVNFLTSTIAADGKQYPPHIAKKITSGEGKDIKEFRYDSKTIQFKSSDINIVKKGLEEVTMAGGTGWPFFTFPIKTAGKTGTAEFGHPEDKTHAWYTAYAPVDNPQISLTVLVEEGGEGSSTTGPIAKEILRYEFSPDKTNLIKDITPVISTESARILGE